MKRHPSLVPLSREHHGSLIMSRLIQKNAPAYKGLPETPEGKRNYAAELFDREIRPHFEKEERLYRSIYRYQELQPLLSRIFEEHKQLTQMFESLKTGFSEDMLHNAGELLEKHIRTEERELFPLMESVCTDEELAGWS